MSAALNNACISRHADGASARDVWRSMVAARVDGIGSDLQVVLEAQAAVLTLLLEQNSESYDPNGTAICWPHELEPFLRVAVEQLGELCALVNVPKNSLLDRSVRDAMGRAPCC